MEIITDRTYEDVQRVIEFEKRGWANLSDEEKAEWLAGMKGALNHTDLNRMIDNSLDIYAKYLEESGATELTLSFFQPTEQYTIVILKEGKTGDIFNRYDAQEVYNVGYGINVLQLNTNFAYVSPLSNNDGRVFELGNYSFVQKLFSLVQRDIFPTINDLEQPLLFGNDIAAMVRRPNSPTNDYRGILSSGVSIDFASLDFEKINECEKTLLLSYNWVFNGMVEFPLDWVLNENNGVISNEVGYNPSNDDVKVHILIPSGYLIEVIYGYPSYGHVASVVGRETYSTGEEIVLETQNIAYMYDFNITVDNNSGVDIKDLDTDEIRIWTTKQ